MGVSRWLAWKGWIKEDDLYEFSRQIENLFHGESSGADIAVALSGKGLHFERDGERVLIEPTWQPRWYLSYSGKRGVTSECVTRVKALWERDAERAREIDADMHRAVEIAEQALMAQGEEQGFSSLVEAIRLARSCFERWDLAGGEMALHLAKLEGAGAVAVKPTGSGDGGFALSLWKSAPPPDLRETLIPIGRI